MPEERSSPVSFRLPSSFAEQLQLRAKQSDQTPSEYVRQLVMKDLTDEQDASLEEQNAEAIKAIRSLANLLRGDVATLASVLLTEVAKWERDRTKAWVEKTFHRAT